MKVALLSFMDDPEAGGGAARSFRFLAHGLTERGIDVVLITTHAKKGMQVTSDKGVTTYRFYPWNLYWVGDKDKQSTIKKTVWQLIDIWNPSVYWRVRRIITRERPDIVHVHKLRGLSPAVWAAAKHAGCPRIVQTCRDYELMSPEGTLTTRVGQWARDGAWLVLPYRKLRARFSKSVTIATAPSRYTLEMLTCRGFFPNARHSVIPNTHGMTLDELDRRKKDSRKGDRNAVRLLYLGRIEDNKGVDLLCMAFVRAASRFPALRLDIAGWGSLEDSLKDKYGDHGRITFHSSAFGERKAQLLAESVAVVVPSVWPEVFGIVIVEAYASGKPVIATRIGGIPEVVDEHETGLLIPPNDVEALENALCAVADNPASFRSMAQNCFRAARRYALESITQSYLDVYESL
ncbi:glycosyltransferase family 4 protein [Acidobacteriota bacterium]